MVRKKIVFLASAANLVKITFWLKFCPTLILFLKMAKAIQMKLLTLLRNLIWTETGNL